MRSTLDARGRGKRAWSVAEDTEPKALDHEAKAIPKLGFLSPHRGRPNRREHRCTRRARLPNVLRQPMLGQVPKRWPHPFPPEQHLYR
jgi:hypothetical protein